jgi:alcohol dehydrogenase class IV
MERPIPGRQYDFTAPAVVHFGWGRRSELAGVIRSAAGASCRRAVVVCGSKTLAASTVYRELLDGLAASGIEIAVTIAASREPTVADVDAATDAILSAQGDRPEVVLAIGGGSAIDLAKAAAAMATQPHSRQIRDYLEGIGRGLQLEAAPLPVVALPTTGGTGTEATRNAVITASDPTCKKSLRSLSLVPKAVLIDPELGVTVSPEVTAWSGMDAITQLVESFVSCRRSSLPQALAREALPSAWTSLPVAVRNGANRPAREALAHAAFVSGLCLANAGLGLAHGVAAALGSLHGVPHGLACATLLPLAIRANLNSVRGLYGELAVLVGVARAEDDPELAAPLFLDAVYGLLFELGIPERLAAFGVKRTHLDAIAEGSRGNSLNGNPRTVSTEELRKLLESAL